MATSGSTTGQTQDHWQFTAVVATVIATGVVVLLHSLPHTQRRPLGLICRDQCQKNLKQIALALHNYESAWDAFPPAYTVDANGKPLHSWRTLILPYLDQEALYKSIDLSKPWDDPVNAKACSAALQVFHCPSTTLAKNRTAYLAVVTPNSCLCATEPRSLSAITDGLDNTLMLIEVDADHAVHWMEPKDADESLVLSLGRETRPVHTKVLVAALADVSTPLLESNLSADQRRALISIDGNDKME